MTVCLRFESHPICPLQAILATEEFSNLIIQSKPKANTSKIVISACVAQRGDENQRILPFGLAKAVAKSQAQLSLALHGMKVEVLIGMRHTRESLVK